MLLNVGGQAMGGKLTVNRKLRRAEVRRTNRQPGHGGTGEGLDTKEELVVWSQTSKTKPPRFNQNF